jgi:phage baseplate assembly protein W
MPTFGFTLPFAKSTGSLGYFDVTRNEIDAIKANLTSLLVTNWGERMMHYHFGCNLIEFLFENRKDSELKNRIADRIITQVGTWMPFLTIDELNIFFASEEPALSEHSIGIRISFRLTNRQNLTGLLSFVAASLRR